MGGTRTPALDDCNSLKAPALRGAQPRVAGPDPLPDGLCRVPAPRLMPPAETGTRGLLGATLGSAADRDEASVAGGCCTCCARACWSCWTGRSMPTGSWARPRLPARRCWRGPNPGIEQLQHGGGPGSVLSESNNQATIAIIGDRPYAAAIRTSAAIEGTESCQEMHAPFTSGEDRIGGSGIQVGSRCVRLAVETP